MCFAEKGGVIRALGKDWDDLVGNLRDKAEVSGG